MRGTAQALPLQQGKQRLTQRYAPTASKTPSGTDGNAKRTAPRAHHSPQDVSGKKSCANTAEIAHKKTASPQRTACFSGAMIFLSCRPAAGLQAGPHQQGVEIKDGGAQESQEHFRQVSAVIRRRPCRCRLPAHCRQATPPGRARPLHRRRKPAHTAHPLRRLRAARRHCLYPQ